MGESTDWDVIIVGAGPVGLALAKGLADDGRKTLVLEKKPGLSEHSKAATLWPAAQETVEQRGLLPRFESESLFYRNFAVQTRTRRAARPC